MEHPTILCIESSGTNCGVALVRDGHVQSRLDHWLPHIHDRQLAEMCRSVLAVHDIDFKDLQAVAVSEGPGSFTGLRIGISLAKALCFDNATSLIAVPTLHAVALAARASARGQKAIAVIVPSQRDKYYFQLFDLDARAQHETLLLSTDDLRSRLDDAMFLCGPSAAEYGAVGTPPDLLRLSAGFLADPAITAFREGHFVDAMTFVPRYVQEFVPRLTPSASQD